MRTMARPMISAVTVLLAIGSVSSAHAAAPSLAGYLQGIELLPQTDRNGALFVFDFAGAAKSGWGWIEVFHESPLPAPGDSNLITGGRGVLWIGWQRYQINVTGGTLTAIGGNLFDLDVFVEIGNWQGFRTHYFQGVLSHAVFPPTIAGILAPSK
jgi:hypothetical protein